MTILIPFFLLLNHPLELLSAIRGDGIAHLADSLDHIFGQHIANFWVARLIGLFVFAISAVIARPGYIREI
jgi:hypothetical protein